MTEPADAVRLALRAQGKLVRFKAGERLFAPGDLAGSWVAIERGRVRVSLLARSGREVRLYRIGAGESCLLTTSSLIGDEPSPAEGFAETDVEAWLVSKATFDRLIAEDPDFQRDVLRNYANRDADLVVTMQDVLFRAIPERLARTLLARESQGIVAATHQEIASDLGSAREVVSRVLQRFEREGLIAIERGRIVIRDPEALRQTDVRRNLCRQMLECWTGSSGSYSAWRSSPSPSDSLAPPRVSNGSAGSA